MTDCCLNMYKSVLIITCICLLYSSSEFQLLENSWDNSKSSFIDLQIYFIHKASSIIQVCMVIFHVNEFRIKEACLHKYFTDSEFNV